MPPSIWPSARVGLIARPTSWAAVTRLSAHGAEAGVDGELDELRAVAVDGVGRALAVGVERGGRRVVGRLRREDSAVGAGGQGGEVDRARAVDGEAGAGEREAGVGAGVGVAQDRGAELAAGGFRRLAGDVGLARAGGLAGVGGQVGVGVEEGEGGDREAERVGEDLGDHGVRALADVDGALVQHDGAVGADADADRRGVGQRGVAAAVPAARDADAVAERARGGVGRRGGGERLRPGRLERLEAVGDADALEDLAGGGGVAVAERVHQAEGEAVDAGGVGEAVEEGLLGDRRLRHAEAAEGAGDRTVGVDGARPGDDVRDAVGAGGVDGHAVRHRRAPARVGAGVEDAVEVEGGQPAVGVAAEAGGDRGRVALGGGRHRLAAGEGHARRAAGREGGEAEQRLDAEVELGAEAAADRRGQDTDALGRQPEQRGGVVAVHAGGLGAGADHHGLAVEPGGAGLGLDVGVLDEAGADFARDDVGGGRQRRAGVAAADPALDQEVAGAAGVDEGRSGRLGGRRVGCAPAAAPRRRGSRRGRRGRRPRRRRAPPPRRGSASRPRPAPAGRRSAG